MNKAQILVVDDESGVRELVGDVLELEGYEVHRGVGTASCGPDTLDQYLIKPGKYTLAYK